MEPDNKVETTAVENNGKPEVSITDKLWHFFGSLKLAVGLLIFIAATSIIGTLIPQNPDEETIQGFIQERGESAYNTLLKLGFLDLYHQWWFMLSMALLMVSLTVCSLDRWPIAKGKYREKP